MNMHHDIADEADAADDLSTLAWVHDELRRSLEAAHKAGHPLQCLSEPVE